MALEIDQLQSHLGQYESNDAAGKKLAEHMAAIAERDRSGVKIPQPRSLGAYVGQLRRGVTTWWEGTRASQQLARRALAEMLGATPEELGLVRPPDPWIAFRDFEALPPLDVHGAPPPELLAPSGNVGRLAWWELPERVTVQRFWYVVPPGFGRSLLASWWERRREGVVLRVASLGELGTLPADGVVVIELDGEGGDEEREALAGLTTRAVVVVLAHRDRTLPEVPEESREAGESAPPPRSRRRRRGPAPTPDRPPDELDPAGHHQVSRKDVEEALRAGMAAAASRGRGAPKWLTVRWTPVDDWRERLVRWVAGRLPDDSPLDADAVIEELEGFADWYAASPDSLMSLLAALHDDEAPVPDDPYDLSLVQRFVRGAVRRHGEEGSADAELLERAGWEFVVRLVHQRVLDSALPLDGGLPLATWEALAAGSGFAGDRDVLVERAAAIAAEADPEARAEALRRFQLDVVGGDRLVRGLVEARLLRLVEPGRFALTPPWLVEQVKVAVAGALTADPPMFWGAPGRERDRYDLLWSTLYGLAYHDPDDFRRAAGEALAPAPDLLAVRVAQMAVLQALLVVGLELIVADDEAEAEFPEQLALVRDLLPPLLRAARDIEVRPFTNTLGAPAPWLVQGETTAALLGVFGGWLASLLLPSDGWDHEGLEPWRVPGYQDGLRPDAMSPELAMTLGYAHPRSVTESERLDADTLFWALRPALARFRDRVDWGGWDDWPPGSIPRVLQPELVVHALALEDDDAAAALPDRIAEIGSMEAELWEEVDDLLGERPDRADLLRRALARHPEAQKGVAHLAWDLRNREALGRFAEVLDEATIRGLLDDHELGTNAYSLPSVPEPFRGAALRWLLADPEEHGELLQSLAIGLHRRGDAPMFDDESLLDELFALIELTTLWNAAKFAWDRWPDACWRELRVEAERGRAAGPRSRTIFKQVPDRQLDRALSWLEEHPDVLEEDYRPGWLARRFGSAEVGAEVRDRLWDLLRR